MIKHIFKSIFLYSEVKKWVNEENQVILILIKERKKSQNTLDAYIGDLNEFSKYLSERNLTPEKAKDADVVGYLLMLKEEGRTSSTINRKLASIRLYYKYLLQDCVFHTDRTLYNIYQQVPLHKQKIILKKIRSTIYEI